MSPELEKLLKMMKAQIAAEAATRTHNPEAETSHNPAAEDATPKKEKIGGKQCHIRALRDALTGQFYALSNEDRTAFNHHCAGIVEDLKPESNRERWLASAIAEDQWRLNRARALENNIFAIGMSDGPISAATNGDTPEVLAAVCQARVWLADGKSLQALSLYEHRIRRNIGKNEKQLRELQAPREAARAQALEEVLLIAEFALSEDANYDPTEELAENGFGFSAPEILRLANRRIRLQKAIQYHNRTNPGTKRPAPTPFPKSKAA
jgi:hypothetical protein